MMLLHRHFEEANAQEKAPEVQEKHQEPAPVTVEVKPKRGRKKAE